MGQSDGMCGRFNVVDNPGLRQLLQDLGIDQPLPERINIAPTEAISLARDTGAGMTLDRARWWLTPAWAPQVDQKYAMFNARSETLASSRAFRHPFSCQRGVVPMSSFIEWRPEGGVRQPWLITGEQRALAVAALWDVWERGPEPLLSCALVTTAAPAEFAPWHARMPLLLTVEECRRWLDNGRPVAADDPLFRQRLKIPLRLEPLDRAVSNARNKRPELLQGVGEAVQLRPGGGSPR